MGNGRKGKEGRRYFKIGRVLPSTRQWVLVFSEKSCAWVKGGRGSLFARYRAGKCDMGGLERVGSEGECGSEEAWVVEQTQRGYGQRGLHCAVDFAKITHKMVGVV